jgi:hypothetical protein
MSGRVLIDLPSSFSDGAESRWNVDNHVRAEHDKIYHNKIADMWMMKHEAAESGTYFC